MSSINQQLSSIFNVKEWTKNQHDTYKLLKHYVDTMKDVNHAHELRDDKTIIRNNFKNQAWFIHSRSKPIIHQLLDSMDLVTYMCDCGDQVINMYLVLKFGHFRVHGCLYKNMVNDTINYYIYFENDKHQRAYLTYYTHVPGHVVSDTVKQIKVPEFDKIYDLIKIDQNLLYQCDLLNFFAEIIMFYDESELIGTLPMSQNMTVNLNQLIQKFNTYVSNKKNDVNYNWENPSTDNK